MRRALQDADFPLSIVGTVIFAKDDPAPLYVGHNVDEAHTLFRLISIGYDVSAIIGGTAGHEAIGKRVLDLFLNAHDPELPLPLRWKLTDGRLTAPPTERKPIAQPGECS
jgi:hypothetical protein